MEELRSLANTGHEDLYTAWEDAFRDYERTWTRAEFGQMLRRRGYAPELSFGAFDGRRLVSFTLNGVGMFNGLQTAYDTGTGTIKEYRGRRLATRIFNESIPVLKEAGVAQYLLEVLQYNATAVSIYTNAGFRISREFDYFVQNMNEVQLNARILPSQYHLQKIDLSRKEEMAEMWDFTPSWQNSFDSIERTLDDFTMIGAFSNDKLIGYGIIEASLGDITQIAVDKAYRRQGIASGILKETLMYNKHPSVKIINIESTLKGTITFIENNGIPKRGSQYEMIKAFG